MPEPLQIHWNGKPVGLLHDPKIDNFFLFGRLEQARSISSALFREAIENETDPIVAIGGSDISLKASCMSIESDDIEMRLIPERS